MGEAMKGQASKWLCLVAIFMFVGATFSIVDENWALGVVFFAVAAVFVSLAGVCRKNGGKNSETR